MELLKETKTSNQEVVRLNLTLLCANQAFEVVVVVHVEDLGKRTVTCSDKAVKRRIGRLSMCFDVMNTFFIGSNSPI